MRVTVFLDEMLYSLEYRYKYFGGNCCLLFQDIGDTRNLLYFTHIILKTGTMLFLYKRQFSAFYYVVVTLFFGTSLF
jgi:hypothetical protein